MNNKHRKVCWINCPNRLSFNRFFVWQIDQEEQKIRSLLHQEKIQSVRKLNNHIVYGLNNVGFISRIGSQTINLWKNNKWVTLTWLQNTTNIKLNFIHWIRRLNHAKQSGQKLIIDCSYDDHMSKKESCSTARQIMYAFSGNRQSPRPFDLQVYNAKPSQSTFTHMTKMGMLDPKFPMEVHPNDFAKTLPSERLVYLTPFSKTDLPAINPNDIYVLPALTDRSGQPAISLAKPKQKQMRTARLPFEKYLNWRGGHGNSLPLNIIVDILIEMRKTGDWQQAFKVIPSRFFEFTTKTRTQRDLNTAGRRNPFELPDMNELLRKWYTPHHSINIIFISFC